jgi:hypothetical protein
MHSILPIAHFEVQAATRRALAGSRRDDPRRQPSRKRSEKAIRSTGGTPTGSPSSVTL